ncbi:hypothetical protein, variant [Aphanomyces invadans]|uniref:3'-5' exonuclease domain-containing protein n=1 Tax=Aphanomyces invadans TaxID=157072 RepID=A0A024TFQ1_9STRA|nr:hypothetical protein, variant [Aphanomyces invadans]ETV92192.1 hypothetical protein, variant [Aphanomyces invadans]|eukprot:XP_008879156.1 hypothetical protein, variant [Aphanomyces invadans]
MPDFINLGLTAGGETLEGRAGKFQRKLRMCGDATSSASRWLSAHFAPCGNSVILVQSHVIFRGYIYYPLARMSTTSVLPRPILPSAINEDHLQGWWTLDFENDLQRTTPSSSRFAILPKLFWLAKVSATRLDDETVSIPGDPGLHLPSIPVLSRDDLFVAVRAHFASSPTAKPLVVAELRPCIHETAFEETSRGAIVNRAMWQPAIAPPAVKTDMPNRSGRRVAADKRAPRPSSSIMVVDVNQASDPTELAQQLRRATRSGARYGTVKAIAQKVLQPLGLRFSIQCILALVAQEERTDKNETFRIGQLVVDATSAISAQRRNDDGGTLHAALLTILADETKWWSVRFLVKAKHTLLNEVRASAMESELERNGDVGAMEGVMTRMLEPDHRGKWHMTAVDLCAAYGLPRAEATASTMLTKLLDANDPVAAEAFVLSQQRCTSRTHRLTQTFMRHSKTRTKAAKRLAALFHSILPSHTPHAANQRPIVNQDHQLTLVQDILATRLSVHLVETPDDVTSMMHWMDEALMDPNHSPNERLQPTKVVIVGLDCEWRPRAFSTKRDTTLDDDSPDLEQIQVIQIAFPHGHVYVLDCMAPSVIDMVVPLFRHLSQPWVVVTGFCVSGDLDRLVASHPGLTDVVHSPDFTCVELRRVAVARAKPDDVPTVQRMGLAGLAASYLNLRIPKDQQTSDWAVRPLSADQIEYAAMDAHCVRLLLLYFTAGLDGPDPVQEPWTISSSLWTAWRVHLQAYLGEADVVAAVASLGLSGTFHTLPTQPHCAVDREGHTVIKTVAWVVQHAQHHASAAACGRSPVQFLAVLVDLAKTIDVNKLHSFVQSKLGLSSCAISLASERVRLLN